MAQLRVGCGGGRTCVEELVRGQEANFRSYCNPVARTTFWTQPCWPMGLPLAPRPEASISLKSSAWWVGRRKNHRQHIQPSGDTQHPSRCQGQQNKFPFLNPHLSNLTLLHFVLYSTVSCLFFFFKRRKCLYVIQVPVFSFSNWFCLLRKMLSRIMCSSSICVFVFNIYAWNYNGVVLFYSNLWF